MEYYDWSLLGPAMLFLNQYFNNAVPEYIVLWLCTVRRLSQLFYSLSIKQCLCDSFVDEGHPSITFTNNMITFV